MKFADTGDKAIPAYCVEQDSTFEKSKTFDQLLKTGLNKITFQALWSVCFMSYQKGDTVALLGLGNENQEAITLFLSCLQNRFLQEAMNL